MKRITFFSSLMLVLAILLLVAQDTFAQNPSPLKVVLLFDTGGRGDGGFNDSAYSGMSKPLLSWG